VFQPAGLLDYYVTGPLARLLQRRFTETDFTLRERLGGGNYGQGGWLCISCVWLWLVCTLSQEVARYSHGRRQLRPG